MQKLFLSTLVFSLLSTLTYAGQDKHAGHNMAADNKASTLSASDKTSLKGLLEKNDALYNSLLGDDSKLITEKARDLKIYLHSRGHSKILNGLHQKLGKLDEIAASKDKNSTLNSYAEFVSPLIELVKKYDIGLSYNVFFCPMVKKSWIQNTDKQASVQNLYAPGMRECGEQVTKK